MHDPASDRPSTRRWRSGRAAMSFDVAQHVAGALRDDTARSLQDHAAAGRAPEVHASWLRSFSCRDSVGCVTWHALAARTESERVGEGDDVERIAGAVA